jgi:hypothetical protein
MKTFGRLSRGGLIEQEQEERKGEEQEELFVVKTIKG